MTTHLTARARDTVVHPLLGIGATAAATGTVAVAARQAFDLDDDFAGLDPLIVGVTTAVALAFGLIVSGVLARRDKGRFVVPFLAAGTALSLIGPITTLFTEPPDGPAHSNGTTAAVLVGLHLIAATAALFLTALHRPRRSS